MSNIIKENIKANAELKTLSDYALIIEHISGYSKSKSRNIAIDSESEPLYIALLERNIELFSTGKIVIQ